MFRETANVFRPSIPHGSPRGSYETTPDEVPGKLHENLSSFKLEAETREAHLINEGSVWPMHLVSNEGREESQNEEHISFSNNTCVLRSDNVVLRDNENENKIKVDDDVFIETPQGFKNIRYARQSNIDNVLQERDTTLETKVTVANRIIKDTVECKLLYHNVNGWSEKKFLTAMNVMDHHKIDIFAITEHKKWRKQDLPDIQDYDRWATCREMENGVGVCV